jgi:hypothetical protein
MEQTMIQTNIELKDSTSGLLFRVYFGLCRGSITKHKSMRC